MLFKMFCVNSPYIALVNTIVRRYCFIVALVLCMMPGNPLLAQLLFESWDDIPVTVSATPLKFPWAGGINNPQFSEIDLDGDGIMDLFIFDRSRDRGITFINNGTVGEIDYEHAPDYESIFPEMHNWALLVDYNCDGKMDIYTSAKINNGGVRVYRNDYNITDGLKFTLVKDYLTVETTPAPNDPVFVSEVDIPAVADIDGDGDIDILSFEWAGERLRYFKNLSIETDTTCDSLIYDLDHYCWGYFKESLFTSTVTMNDTCAEELKGERKMHPGSTTLALDLNSDTIMDLIVGDILTTAAYMLTNGGTKSNALIINYDSLYPLVNPIAFYTFPATYYVDVDFDGVRDLLAAPNQINSGNFKSSWYYSNNGTDSSPNFQRISTNFLQDEMIEVGEASYPVFFDYNSDGLLDLVIGNGDYYIDGINDNSGLSLYKNVGTQQSPSFDLITRDYAGLFALNPSNINNIYPAFGDLDDDGDLDMFIGEFDGNLHYYENTAGKGNIASFVIKEYYYDSIDVGTYSKPQLVDVDRDGLLDLLIGEKSTDTLVTGDSVLNLFYYKNVGTKSNPVFSLRTEHFGNINFKPEDFKNAHSAPFLTVLESTGESTLLIGMQSGYIARYTNIDGNLTGTFTLKDSLFMGIKPGLRPTISGGDLNLDGTIDMVVGNMGGGAYIYKNIGDSLIFPPPQVPFNILMRGNPVGNSLNIAVLGSEINDQAEVAIYNIFGQLIFYKTYYGKGTIENILINTISFASALYFCRVTVSNTNGSTKDQIMKKFFKTQ